MGRLCIGWRSLRYVCPNLTKTEAQTLARVLAPGMVIAGATTPRRAAMLIAQYAHECDRFNTTHEYASGADYEGRRDLGNLHRGDGKRYRGRGFIQITGRANYRLATGWVRADWPRLRRLFAFQRTQAPNLETEPQIVQNSLAWASAVSGLWWRHNHCNTFCDRNDFIGLTRRINGGTNGLADRQALYRRARRVSRFLTPKER